MPNPLFKKLGLKDGQKVILKNIPENYFDLLIEIPDVEECEEGEFADFIHVFEKNQDALKLELSTLFEKMKPNGMIWISWPKKTSGVATDLDYHSVKAIASRFGLQDVKVSAIDEIWTACRYIIPLKNRK
ncbi:DUF3052 family protein [Lacihabitans sp. LS3-19]|uniref:DUF3052 domain-containing protein n=1 Tax=Lacihabitans sp. LS3-19 TaxID=2487335 RepID=UPI0020CC57ED|nr:DUF3052 domain-containing protein [Lacihabitans sp. LS3-19]MCP9767944.1 DUF3052 family protein [Lacihabitans sp. LS3-19]